MLPDGPLNEAKVCIQTTSIDNNGVDNRSDRFVRRKLAAWDMSQEDEEQQDGTDNSNSEKFNN